MFRTMSFDQHTKANEQRSVRSRLGHEMQIVEKALREEFLAWT